MVKLVNKKTSNTLIKMFQAVNGITVVAVDHNGERKERGTILKFYDEGVILLFNGINENINLKKDKGDKIKIKRVER